MYDRTSTSLTVNEASKDLFTRKGRSIENIPPTYGALVEHTKRVAYQAGYCRGVYGLRLRSSVFGRRACV